MWLVLFFIVNYGVCVCMLNLTIATCDEWYLILYIVTCILTWFVYILKTIRALKGNTSLLTSYKQVLVYTLGARWLCQGKSNFQLQPWIKGLNDCSKCFILASNSCYAEGLTGSYKYFVLALTGCYAGWGIN